ncbi:hypothetical protein HID58_062763 [Brassica napus]|uniref:F-box associated beta-propeller type 3 domain-containing protein n=1 Tax=Brassica napus TaxID=3708 RepID=A0ABQ8A2A1_BRANA|nr:hypothetical protein HID58_062763 [Brassica napus]
MNDSVLTFSPRFTRSSLSIPDDLFLRYSRVFLTKPFSRPQLLFVFEAHREIAFFSSPQPENPEENSYVVAANQLARFPSAYGFSARTSGFFCYQVEHIFEGSKVAEFVPVISAAYSSYERTMVACFDLRSEKFSFVNFSRAMPSSTTLVNYNGKLGLLMSGDLGDFGDIAILDVAARNMCIAEMVGVNEIVLAPWFQNVPSYVIYFNVERKTITKVGIQGMEAFQGKRFDTYLNYVENVKLI